MAEDFNVHIIPANHSSGNNDITLHVSPIVGNNDFQMHQTENAAPDGTINVIHLIIDDAPGSTGHNPIVFDLTARFRHDPEGFETRFDVYHKDDHGRTNRRGTSVVVIAHDEGGGGYGD